MGRTSQNNAKKDNPVKFWMSFKGDTGVYTYYNGTENVQLPELKFVLLDVRYSVTGWSDKHSSKIWSNVVEYCGNQELVVKAKKTELFRGLWADIKKEVNDAGGNYTVNLYVLAEIDGVYQPACIQLDKGGLKEWSDFLEQTKLSVVYSSLVTTKRGEQQKKGAVKYYTPVFTMDKLSDELNEMANTFESTVLKPFLSDEKPVVTQAEERTEQSSAY